MHKDALGQVIYVGKAISPETAYGNTFKAQKSEPQGTGNGVTHYGI